MTTLAAQKIRNFTVNEKLSYAAFGRRYGVCRQTVHGWVYQGKRPRPETQIRLHKDKIVCVEDWFRPLVDMAVQGARA